jgi:hypothetical protein
MTKNLIHSGIITITMFYAGSLHAQTESIAKMLGNMVGGGGVSAADSVKATKSFLSAKGGSGVYYQYITTMTSKQRGTNYDTSNIYFTNSGEGRSEMNLPGMMGMKGGNTMITLAHADQRQYSLTLDASDKTYSLNVIDTSLINRTGSNYQVTKIGNENILGYNCTHAKVVSNMGSGMFKSSSTMDIWTSTDIPGYAIIKDKMTVQNMTPSMMRALAQAGCAGFFVKMIAQGKDYSMTMTLVKAQQKNFPAAMFQVPAGYTESKENMFSRMMGAKQ